MNLELDFNKEEEDFYYKNADILKNIFERVALKSAEQTIIKLKPMLDNRIYDITLKKIEDELKKLK